MPLDIRKMIDKHKGLIGNAFWILVLAAAYVLMTKAMHPGQAVFGI